MHVQCFDIKLWESSHFSLFPTSPGTGVKWDGKRNRRRGEICKYRDMNADTKTLISRDLVMPPLSIVRIPIIGRWGAPDGAGDKNRSAEYQLKSKSILSIWIKIGGNLKTEKLLHAVGIADEVLVLIPICIYHISQCCSIGQSCALLWMVRVPVPFCFHHMHYCS